MPRSRDLRRRMARYRPRSPIAAHHAARLMALVDEPGDPFDRTRFDPGHVTVGAFVLSPDGRELLLVHHRRLGIWVQPGGHVEPNDLDVLAAARREVAEETGLTGFAPTAGVIFDVDIHGVSSAPGGDPAHLHFDVRFLLHAVPPIALGGGTEAARWVPLADVACHTTDESVGRAVRELTEGTPLS